MVRDAMKTGLFSIAGTRMIIFLHAARTDDRMGEVSGLCSPKLTYHTQRRERNRSECTLKVLCNDFSCHG